MGAWSFPRLAGFGKHRRSSQGCQSRAGCCDMRSLAAETKSDLSSWPICYTSLITSHRSPVLSEPHRLKVIAFLSCARGRKMKQLWANKLWPRMSFRGRPVGMRANSSRRRNQRFSIADSSSCNARWHERKCVWWASMKRRPCSRFSSNCRWHDRGGLQHESSCT